MLVTATNDYAEQKKYSIPSAYRRLSLSPLTKEEMWRYLGFFQLLSTRNYRQTCNPNSSQVSYMMQYLAFITARQEEEKKDHPLRKVLPLHSHMKEKCFELYQPLAHLSMDEHMVKSKARSHFRQYIRNKPTKWGFKYWVLSDPTGYTVDFDLYCGAQRGQPISFDVVMQLVQP